MCLFWAYDRVQCIKGPIEGNADFLLPILTKCVIEVRYHTLHCSSATVRFTDCPASGGVALSGLGMNARLIMLHQLLVLDHGWHQSTRGRGY